MADHGTGAGNRRAGPRVPPAMDGPNPISVGLSVLKARRVARPRPGHRAGDPSHAALAGILEAVRAHGVAALSGRLDELDTYARTLAETRPDDLSPDGALAYWLNLYNAGALTLAGEAVATRQQSVLRLPGAFTREFVTVAGESLSLNDVEHGKIRRFRDPRIHAALVCGSASCPTLRFEPYVGERLEGQLDDQIRSFLAAGGSVIEDDVLKLSRVFLWYGADFVHPDRMPTILPAPRRRVASALRTWLPNDQQDWLRSGCRRIAFQPYDWSLACSVRKPV
ncbi:MAG: DUF547 domain-containing protein [Acidimicrobiia bacterium]